MTWAGWAIVLDYILTSAGFVLSIGRRRAVLTPGNVLGVLAINTALVVGVLTVGTGHL